MRTVIGALIFSLTFFVGVKVAWVAGVVTKFSMPAEIHRPDVNDRAERFARSPVGIRVSYIGLTGPTLRFLIHNGSTETLSCVGYSGMCASPEIRINGEDAKAWVCMNGSSTYLIEPGETVELAVGPYDFAPFAAQNGNGSGRQRIQASWRQIRPLLCRAGCSSRGV